MDRIQRAGRVRIEPAELGIKVVLRVATGGDEFEALAPRPVGRQAGNQDLRDLAARDDPVAGITSLTAIPLKEDESMLV